MTDTTTFHILDAFAQDLQIEREDDTTREVSYVEDGLSEDDDEVRTRPRGKARNAAAAAAARPRHMVIHLFGSTAAGKPLRVNVNGFRPFFFVRLPTNHAETRLEFDAAVEKAINKKHKGVEITYETRKLLFGYTGGVEVPFARISMPSLTAFRGVRSLFLDKSSRPSFHMRGHPEALEVFEAGLDPMLRFFHLRNLQPCGWVTIPGTTEHGELDVEWEDVSPCTAPPAPAAPFLLASWDIECYSENGEFPVAKRGYERIAKLLVQNATDVEDAIQRLQNAILYPDNPPKGMDPIRSKKGGIPKRAALEAELGKESFRMELAEALEGREELSAAGRAERAATVLALLNRTLRRAVPIAGDPIIQIGVVLQRGAGGPLDKHIFVLGTCSAVDGATVYAYKTEREMILGWAAFLRAQNPDMLLGYNVFGFDERYVWDRAMELGLVHEEKDDRGFGSTVCEENLHALSRLFDQGKDFALETKFLSSSALGDNTMYVWSAHGRLQIDLYHYVKRSFALASYKLDDVCQHFMSGKLTGVVCEGDRWTLQTKSTSDVVPGRSVVLLDETGDGVVEKLKVLEVQKGKAVIVEAPTGDDRPELEIAAGTAVKWAVVKDDVSPQEIFKLHRGDAADRARVAAYCVQDCVLVLDLYKKLDVFNNAMAMANACSVPVSYIFTRGQGVKIESLIFKECYERRQTIVTLPAPPQRDAAPGAVPGGPNAEESYEGAIVLDPNPGFYFGSPIGVADFASLYPSTIISENISYDTLVWVKDFNLDGSFRGYGFGSEACEAPPEAGVRYTDISFDIWGFDPEDKRKHPAKIRTGTRICRYAQLPGDIKGALPDIVQKLLAARKAKRKEADKETDPFRKALLDAEQLAYKLTANSLYGQLGSGTFKIRLQHLAASVTAYGRKQILFAKAAIEKFYGPAAGDPRCSAEMVYGDTDSLFVNFNVRDPATGEPLKGRAALEATMHLTEEAGKFVTRCLKPPHDFEYDKVFAPFIIFSKKRYVGNKYESSPEEYSQTSMGIATKRRDYAPIVKVIYGGALRILLTEQDIRGAIDFVKEKLIELVEGKMSMNLLTMSKSLRAEYKSETPPAHKVLAERIAARDPGNAPASGDRIPFIYVMPPPGQQAAKLQGDRVETPGYIRAKGLKPDVRFYIEHQLMNPITQLFSLVAEQIPGVVPPKAGWAKASAGEREVATTEAIFREAFSLCDKKAVQLFGARLFGTAIVDTAAAAAAKPRTRSQTAATGGATPASTDATKPKVQPTINSFFVNRILAKGLEDSVKQRRAASSSPPPAQSTQPKPKAKRAAKATTAPKGKVVEL